MSQREPGFWYGQSAKLTEWADYVGQGEPSKFPEWMLRIAAQAAEEIADDQSGESQ